MTDRPILFSVPMVRAIIEGRKTVTRRIVTPQPSAGIRRSALGPGGLEDGHGRTIRVRFEPGDWLWVRETWGRVTGNGVRVVYRADGDHPVGLDGNPVVGLMVWKPSIHMPRHASRLTLEVTSVRVERLHDITEEDAEAEGVSALDGSLDEAALCRRAKDLGGCAEDARTWFAELWDKINGKRADGAYAWAKNPWVYRVEFRIAGATEVQP